MIRHREVGATPPQVSVGKSEPLKRLGRSHFVQQMTIDVYQCRPVIALLDQMSVPKFVV